MLLKLHILTIVFSYLAFLAASAAAMLYLIQNSALKNKRIGIIFSKLPDLSALDKFIYKGIGLGFPVLTFSVICGFIWTKDIHGVYWHSHNPRQLYSLILWLVYAVILHVRLTAGLRGRKVAALSLFAFAIIVISLFSACP